MDNKPRSMERIMGVGLLGWAACLPGCAAYPRLPGGVEMTFVEVPAGTFHMGSPQDDTAQASNETPRHKVHIQNTFYIGMHEVTQAQWEAVMGYNPSHFKGLGGDFPVENVSWQECEEFCEKLTDFLRQGTDYIVVRRNPNKLLLPATGFFIIPLVPPLTAPPLPTPVRTGDRQDVIVEIRLPTEAEWEYACRAGTGTRYSFGNVDVSLDLYAWYYDLHCPDRNKHPYLTPQPVGRLTPNPWGLHDMHGNVWEWCQDRFGAYPAEDQEDPRGASAGTLRVARGGSWNSDARSCRSAFRAAFEPTYRSKNIGLRVVGTYVSMTEPS